MDRIGVNPVGIIGGLVLLSVALFVIGLMLRRRGKITSRRALLIWALLVLLPLFGVAPILFLTYPATPDYDRPEALPAAVNTL